MLMVKVQDQRTLFSNIISPLLFQGLSFVAHEVDLTQQKNYNPAYVALRAEGGKDLALVGGSHTWTGSTAASDSGSLPN